MKTKSRNYINQIAAKLMNDGLTAENYNRSKANAILNTTVLPTKLKIILANNEDFIIKLITTK